MLKNFYQLLFPYTCILCAEKAAPQTRDLCKECELDLPWTQSVCHQCGSHITHNNRLCGACQQQSPPYHRLWALCDYTEPMNRIITAAKFNHNLVYARVLGELLAQQTQKWYAGQALPQIIIPVPLHTQRLRERGYNQALEIAKVAAKRLHLPIKQVCQRVKATLPQSSLAHDARDDNVKNAFKLRRKIEFKHVAIIDDVVTTGHTVGVMSQILRQTGVEQIDVWCCAKSQWRSHVT